MPIELQTAEMPWEPHADPDSGREPVAVGERAVVVIVTGQLGFGGSERQLYLFLTQCDLTLWQPHLYVSGTLGRWEQPIRDLGVDVTLLRGSPATKALSLRRACTALGADAFVSWASYTNVYSWALTGLALTRTGSFRNAAYADLPSRGRWLWAWFSKSGLSTVICNSRETADALGRGKGPRQVLFVANAIESIVDAAGERAAWRQRLGVASDDILVMGIGRLSAQKNFARFIDAVASIRRPRVRAIIIGPDYDHLQADLECRIARSGLPPDTIRLAGSLADARLAVCAADIFLLSSDHEGMPNVVMEAMAAGVPVVTTPVNGISTLIEDGKEGLIAQHDSRSLALAVSQLAGDPATRSQMGDRARHRMTSGYSADAVYRPVWQMLREGLADRARLPQLERTRSGVKARRPSPVENGLPSNRTAQ